MELPDSWDQLAENYFQRKKFLCHTEKYNPCNQRYYLQWNGDLLVSAAVVYTLHLDLLTFIRVKSPVKMHIAGIPCSVSSPGIFGKDEAVNALKAHIFKEEKGFVLFLNLITQPEQGKIAGGKTLPTILIHNTFDSWDHYLSLLRAPYRRRLKMLESRNNGLVFQTITPAEFSQTMYKQYLQVYNKSKDKLEKLSCSFFVSLPDDFEITACILHEVVIGWNISLMDHSTFYFFLGGIDYTANSKYNTYLHLLSRLVKKGIENKAEVIDLGQTAEIPKMRMGGRPDFRYMQAYHSNRFVNFLLRRFSSVLEYKTVSEKPHPFKNIFSEK